MTFGLHIYKINLWATKLKEVKKISPRTGRPTNNPKNKPIHVRLDSGSDEILTLYCKQENVSRAEAIREGIKELERKIKK